MKGAKKAWEGLKGVDYGKLWNDTCEVAGTLKDNAKDAYNKHNGNY